MERSAAYSYFKNKHETILKSFKLLDLYEELCTKFKDEEKAIKERVLSEGGFPDL